MQVHDAPERLPAVGTAAVTVVQQVRAQGDFDSPLEARASRFIRTVPGLRNIPVAHEALERAQSLYGLIMSPVNYARELAERGR